MLRSTFLATGLALSMGLFAASAHAAGPLQLKVYNADAGSFHVNSVLISGEKEAVLIDTGFTRADALRIAANIAESGKQLTTIYISQADPDYYFGAELLHQLFPQAQVLAAPAVRERIAAKMASKVAFWGPKLGANNGPKQPLLPTAFTGTSLTVDGETLELRGLNGPLAHRPWVWVPSLRAVVGNIAVFGQLHVWTADTQTPAERQAWRDQLAEMSALSPAVVVPGHMLAGTPLDASNIRYTNQYLLKFEDSARSARTSAELIDMLKAAYPSAGLGIALEIGAKVNKGDMKW